MPGQVMQGNSWPTAAAAEIIQNPRTFSCMMTNDSPSTKAVDRIKGSQMKNVTSWLLQELMVGPQSRNATIREYAPGEAVFRVGDPGDYLGVLLVGNIEIRKGGKVVSILEPGCMFGEMGIIDGQPRIADAIAQSQSRIAEVREGQFMALLEDTPHFALAVMRLLTDRLRRQLES